MLEKFNDLHWFARFFLMMLVAAGIWYGFDYFLLSSTRAETLELRTKLSGLKSSNAEAAIVESHLPEYKAQFEQLKGQYDQAKELLPENVELSKVLESLQVTARNNNLLVVNFSPAGNEKADVQKEFYRMKPVNIKLIGNYANLEKFFLQISDLKRVVNISSLEIVALPEQREGQTLGASFTLSALYADKQDVNNLKPQPPKAVTANGATPAATTTAATP